ncbi:MAG: DUF357 domain-containing protein [Candidatus Marsarchaeota archaeon]|jgi:hypothetical protein|nr:DUF357 domain-containing protein [Candidatus Marsarchaeota archaeon]MCL5418381.1 DUF357 domain-containing protein [Candidatus Marsarchaeota archaeon]
MAYEEERTKERILKDIKLFYESYNKMKPLGLAKDAERVIELSEMYARDAESYLGKGDLYTAFSCISYAHGLLDAVKEMSGAGIEKDL